jgi:hypothetical protein
VRGGLGEAIRRESRAADKTFASFTGAARMMCMTNVRSVHDHGVIPGFGLVVARLRLENRAAAHVSPPSTSGREYRGIQTVPSDRGEDWCACVEKEPASCQRYPFPKARPFQKFPLSFRKNPGNIPALQNGEAVSRPVSQSSREQCEEHTLEKDLAAFFLQVGRCFQLAESS